MSRTSFRVCLGLIVLVGLPGFGRAQTALENLERQLPLPPAGTKVGVSTPAPAGDAAGEPGYLGIVADESVGRGGVRLIDVLPGGPADAAGMRIGDVLTSIDGAAVNTLDELGATLTRRVAGEKVAMIVIRGADALRYDVVLTKRPPPEQRRYPNFGRLTGDNIPGGVEEPLVIEPPTGSPAGAPLAAGSSSSNPLPPNPGAVVDPDHALPPPTAGPSVAAGPIGVMRPRTGLLGVRVVPVTPELQLAMNLPEPRGALIVEVYPDSPARAAGLPVDAVIVAANGKRVSGPDDLAKIVGEIGDGGSVRLTYYRFGESNEKVVGLAAPPAAEPMVISPGPVLEGSVPPAAIPPSVAGPAGPTLGPTTPANAAPVPKSVADENERLRARIAELEAQLKAAQGPPPSTSSGQAKPK